MERLESEAGISCPTHTMAGTIRVVRHWWAVRGRAALVEREGPPPSHPAHSRTLYPEDRRGPVLAVSLGESRLDLLCASCSW